MNLAIATEFISMPVLKSVSLWLRLAAVFYDLFPLIALWMLSAGVFLLAAHGQVDAAHPPFAYRIALRATLLSVSAAYFVVSWARGGQT
ncbi:MAG: RDD family protein, partial [Dokdonella sp.]